MIAKPYRGKKLIWAHGIRCRVSGRPVLKGLDLDLQRGQAILIQGENGAGKTTLLRVLAGLLRPTQGGMLWFGQTSLETHPEIRKRMGYVAHEILLYEDLTAYQNLVLFAQLYDVEAPRRRVMAALEDAGLWKRRDDSPRKFSRGMRARLALARVLLHRPEVLLLDEPSSGLDSAGRKWIQTVLRKHCDGGGAAIITTHDPAVWKGLANGVRFLEAGQLHRQAKARS